MKKLLALFLSLCMVLTMVSGLAEAVTEEQTNAAEQPAAPQEAADSDLGDLFALLFTEDDAAAEGGEASLNLSALLGGLFGDDAAGKTKESVFDAEAIIALLIECASEGDTALDEAVATVIKLCASPVDAGEEKAAAESKDSFFGTWKLLKSVRGDQEIPAETMGQSAKDLALTLAEDTLTVNIEAGDTTAAIVTELVDGALNVTVSGNTIPVYLTKAGELVFGLNGAKVYLVPGTADTALTAQTAKKDEESLGEMFSSLLGLTGDGESGDSGLRSLSGLLGSDGESSGLLSGLLGSLTGGNGEGSGLDLSGLLGGLFGGDSEGSGLDLSGLLGGLLSSDGEGSGLDLGGLLGGLLSSDGEGSGLDLGGLLGGLTGGDGEGSGLDLGGLLGGLTGGDGDGSGLDLGGLLGGLTGGDSDGSGLDLGSLLGGLTGGEDVDLNALLGGEEAGKGQEAATPAPAGAMFDVIAKPANAVAAESKEQFFGEWKLHKITLEGMDLPAEALGEAGSLFVVKLTENSFYMMDGEEEITADITTELVDGALNVTVNGATAAFYLLDDGHMVFSYEEMLLDVAPAPAK